MAGRKGSQGKRGKQGQKVNFQFSDFFMICLRDAILGNVFNGRLI